MLLHSTLYQVVVTLLDSFVGFWIEAFVVRLVEVVFCLLVSKDLALTQLGSLCLRFSTHFPHR